MNLKQLYYLKCLSEIEHHTEAASSLRVAQPSLSHMVSELEKKLGVVLLVGQGRNVRITQNGRRLLSYVEDTLASLEDGRMTLQKNGAENKENIRIASIYTMGEHIVPRLINQYSLSPECHNVTFSFTQGTLLTLLRELKAGKVDLVIYSYVADKSGIDFIPIIQQELVMVTTRDYLLACLYEHEVGLVEMIHCPCIYFSDNNGLHPFIDNVFMRQRLMPETAYYVDEDTVMAGLVSIDYGTTIMPRISALSYYDIHTLKIKNTIPPRHIYLATMKDRLFSLALQPFKNVVIHDSQNLC